MLNCYILQCEDVFHMWNKTFQDVHDSTRMAKLKRMKFLTPFWNRPKAQCNDLRSTKKAMVWYHTPFRLLAMSHVSTRERARRSSSVVRLPLSVQAVGKKNTINVVLPDDLLYTKSSSKLTYFTSHWIIQQSPSAWLNPRKLNTVSECMPWPVTGTLHIFSKHNPKFITSIKCNFNSYFLCLSYLGVSLEKFLNIFIRWILT